MPAIAIVQARMGSTRLPGKVLRTLVGKPMLWHIVQRLRAVPGLGNIVVATSTSQGDIPIQELCRGTGIPVFAGSEDDVLDRYYQAARQFGADPVLRITADCPLVDPGVVGRVLSMFAASACDYVGVATGAGAIFMKGGRFPDGLDAECFSFAALERAWREATARSDREHVTPYIWRNTTLFRTGSLLADKDYAEYRWTVDTEDDFRLVRAVYEALYQEGKPFGMQDVLTFMEQHQDLMDVNREQIHRTKYRAVWHGGADVGANVVEGGR